jgi:hypothetical protein
MNDAQSSVSVASVASSTTQRGVRLHIKKQLAEDIESNGGIQHFAGRNQNLYHLLKRKFEEDPDVHPYGNRGDVIRQQIRRVVNSWIEKDKEGKYISEVLNPWCIVQWSARMPQTGRKATRPPQAPDDDDSLPSSEDSFTATAARNPPTSSYTPPRQVVVDAARPPPSTPLTPPTTSFLKMSLNENANSSDNQNKRKIGVYDVEDVRTNASKFPGCSESDHSILC